MGMFTVQYFWIPPILLKHGRALYAQFPCTFLFVFLFRYQHLKCITKRRFISKLPSWLELFQEVCDLSSDIVVQNI